MSVGVHEAIWDEKNINGVTAGNGVYIYMFKADDYIKKGKIMFLR